MRNLLMLSCIVVFGSVFFSCANHTPIVLSENQQRFDGKWKLVKISYGYPAPNMPTFTTNVSNVEYSFNGEQMTYMYKKDGKMIENGTFELETKKGGVIDTQLIKFTNLKQYTTYSFDKNNTELIMYERMPVGAMLADGNNYHFTKQ